MSLVFTCLFYPAPAYFNFSTHISSSIFFRNHFTTPPCNVCYCAPTFEQAIITHPTRGCVNASIAPSGTTGRWRAVWPILILLLMTYKRQTLLKADRPNWEPPRNHRPVMDRRMGTQRSCNPDVTSKKNVSPGFLWILVKIAVETVLCAQAGHSNYILFLALRPLSH